MSAVSREDFLRRLAATPSITITGRGMSSGSVGATGSAAPGVGGGEIADDALNIAYRLFARLVLHTLQSEPDIHTVFELLKPIGATSEQLLPVIRWMEAYGLVQVTDRDPTGNWKIQVTSRGQEFLQPPA